MPLILIGILVIVILILFWVKFIIPILRSISSNIREQVFPDITNNAKIFITLSTGAIVFTINLNSPSNQIYLNIAWLGFLTCIAISVFLLFTHFLHRVSDKIFLHQMEEYQKDRKESSKKKLEKIFKLMHNSHLLSTTIFLLYYLQIITLFLSLFFLVLFGIKNL